MTMPRATTLLISFTSKIEEAVVLVPRMGVTEKLKAVQFWNVVSEKLQDIVNKNAADINAVALKMDDSDANELCLEMSHLSDAMNPLNNTSEFMHTPPTTTIYNEYSTQFHNADLQSSHLKQEIPSELITSNTEPLEPQSEIPHMSEIPHNNQDTDIPQTKTQDNSGQLHSALSLSSPYDSSANEPQLEHSTAYEEGNSSYSLKSNSSQRSPNKRQRVQPSRQIKKEHAEVGSDDHSESEMNILKKALMKGSSKLKCSSSSSYKNLPSKTMNDLEDSLSAGDLEPQVSLEELDEENSEHIASLLNSNREEILGDCEGTLKDINEKNTNIDSSNTCTICGKQYSNQTALKQHSIIHKKSFSCTECTSVFATNTKLIVHMRRHTGEKPYACPQCSACFSTQGNLKRHVMSHDGVKPWKCSECDSCFTEKKSLTIHMRRHTGERPYKCKICGKGFTQAGVLESHMAMHLGIKKHLCEKCGKAFRQRSQLRVHRLRHENVKKFKCDTCSMLFLTKADLERHGKTHSGEKPYVCDVCSKRFTRQQSLNEHLNRHYGIKPYTCEHCGKKFVEMSSFYKHLKFHNKDTSRGDQEKTEIISHEHEIPKAEDHIPRSETSNTENVMPLLKAKNTDNSMSSIEEGTQYIAVVLNGEDTQEVQSGNNQTILCDSGNSENNIVANNFGVLTTINLVPNASIMPAGYLS